MRSLAAALLLTGCTVPLLSDLPPKRCDAAHPCVAGWSCTAAGLCEEQAMGSCPDGGAAVAEVCDGRDNDCDGKIDEDLFDANPCELDVGVCAGKHHACVGGAFEATCGAASYGADWEAFETRCDGKDNDCDRATDESGGMCMPVGVCMGFVATCAGVCTAPGFEPTETSCDGLDNDCDGQKDEGLDNGVSCGVSAGVCAGKSHGCAGDGGYEPVCGAASFGPTYEPREATCDGLDNDCNGTVDRLPDGGALITAMLCEYQAGVCAGARRACASGAAETPCTAASYGPQYAPIELTCDGRDDDCDGRVDRSRELVLAGGPSTQTHVSFVVAPAGGLAVVYADDLNGTKKVLFRLVPTDGPAGAPLDLSMPQSTGSTSPSMVPFSGSQGAVTWLDTAVGNVPRVLAARVDLGGAGISWQKVASSGRAIFGSPRVAVAGGTSVVLVWIDAMTSTLRGAVYDTAGTPTVAAKVLSTPTLADGGFLEQVLGADVVDSPAGVAIGWTAFEGGESFVRVRNFDAALNPQGALIEQTVGGEAARGLRLSRTSTGALTGAWIGNSSNVRYLQPDAGQRLITSASGTVTDLDTFGPVIVWSEGSLTTQLFGYAVGASVTPTALSLPDAGSVLSPAVRVLATGVAVLAYEVDPGTGFDLRAQFICQP